jgi:iron-sulfur cluster insertion protein
LLCYSKRFSRFIGYNVTMITLTDLAKQKLQEIIDAEGLENQFVRVKLRGGGCAGMMTEMEFNDLKSDTDELIEVDNIKIIIDPISNQYLENTEIDYINSHFGGGFKFNSPNAISSCGCGKSQLF